MTSDNKLNSFYNLDPLTILNAIEGLGFACTGRFLQLNSLENRVYEIELEVAKATHTTERFIVTKFYRPERWTIEQLKAEHQFLLELDQEEIAVVPPLIIKGETLFTCRTTNIHFAIYPKFSGRNPDEFSELETAMIGRLLARIHQVGTRQVAPARRTLDIFNFAEECLTYLTHDAAIPATLTAHITQAVREIFTMAKPFAANLKLQRIHADAHRGNIIKRNDTFYWLDFDDFLNGPAIQDLWLLFPGRDSYSRKKLELLIQGYQELRSFEYQDLFLIEPLRVLRVLYFNVWIHKRWSDPYFKRTFESFGTEHYWQEQCGFFTEQQSVFRTIVESGQPLSVETR